jgi:hypothetical protein
MGLLDRFWRRLAGRSAPPHDPSAAPAEPVAPPRRAKHPTAAQRAQTREASADRLQADAEVTYARERLSLYRARALTGQDTNPARLRQLERDAVAAEERASHLRAGAPAEKPPE